VRDVAVTVTAVSNSPLSFSSARTCLNVESLFWLPGWC